MFNIVLSTLGTISLKAEQQDSTKIILNCNKTITSNFKYAERLTILTTVLNKGHDIEIRGNTELKVIAFACREGVIWFQKL